MHRQKTIDGGVPDTPPIDFTCYVLWGKSVAVLNSKWSNKIQDQFSNAIVEIAEDARHFVDHEQPSLANQRMMSLLSG